IPLSYWGFGHRIDSSAPQPARSMIWGGLPGAVTADGNGNVSTGASGGLISTALTFWGSGCSTFAGTYPNFGRWSARAGGACGPGRGRVGRDSAGRVTAICTVVVRPTKTGSVPCGAPATGVSGPRPSMASASYQGPQLPSDFLARILAEVPVR